MTEDDLSKKERKEVKGEIKKALHKQLLEKATAKTTAFGSEFKKQASTAIMTAFGLVIALAWKDVITEWVSKINPAPSSLFFSALILTAISIIGIGLISKWSKTPDKK